MTTVKRPLWFETFKHFAAPLIVYLISQAVALIIWVPVWRGQSDNIMANIHVIGTLAQILMDLPAVAMFIYLRMDREWGSSLRQHLIGAGVGAALAVVIVGLKFLISGADQIVFMRNVPAFTQSLTLDSPWNLISASAALLAYGPGEAVAITYFMLAFDRILGSRDKPSWLTWGVVIGAVLWALPHLLNAPFQGLGSALANTIKMIIIGLIFGMTLRGSKSWVAPVIFWTLTNGTP